MSASSESIFVDSGATHHIFTDARYVYNLKPSEVDVIQTGGAELHKVQGEGDVILNGGPSGNVTLHGVLLVPTMCAHLLSACRADQAGHKINVGGGILRIQNAAGQTIVNAAKDARTGLYRVKAQPNVALGHAAISRELLHKRYGHPGRRAQQKIEEDHEIRGQLAEDCEICIKAKLPPPPFPSSSERAAETNALVHSDVVGPVEVPSLSGSRHIVTLLDDKTGYVSVGIYETKAGLAGWVQDQIERRERAVGKRVKTLRTDGGHEFKGDLDKWLKTKGIVHQTSAPYTPQQNGRAERINRTLLERARAMLLESQLPKEFWAAAVRVAAVLHNYTPAADQKLTPHELFHGAPPDTTRLRVFGCKAYAMIPKEKRKKFDARAEQGVFIGYAEDTKAWQVLVWHNHRPVLLETPAVRFLEEQMPNLKELKAMAPAIQEDHSSVTFGLVPVGIEEGTRGTRPGGEEDGAGDITAGGEGEITGDCESNENENAKMQGHSEDEDDTRHETPKYTLRGRDIFDRRGQAHKATAHDSGWSWDNPTVSRPSNEKTGPCGRRQLRRR
jgi:hypothetical protein